MHVILELHDTSRWWKLQERSILSELVALGHVGSPFVRLILTLADGTDDFTSIHLLVVEIQETADILDIYVVRLLLVLDAQ